jgi:Raf kinase inhibitor-like YbhB/YbcL family protein
MSILLTSKAFDANGPIPKQHTGEGPNVSPPLTWTEIPKAAKELVLICEDPDAPRAEPFVHWVLYGISPEVNGLPEAIPKEKSLQTLHGAVQGMNSFEQIGYNGPMPPKGHGIHHYHFRLYVLDRKLDLPGGLDKSQVLSAIKKRIIEEAELVGTFARN